MKIEKVEKYGAEVYSNVEMDRLRQEWCLCLNCSAIGKCKNAKNLYQHCKATDMALMVTRCPNWRKL